MTATIHASAVLVGPRAVLIRGPSGSGKSKLALALLETARSARLPFARLVADDRALLAEANGRLLVRPAPSLAGLIEIRGVGLRGLPYEPVAVVGWVVDLNAEDAERMPEPTACAVFEGVAVRRLAVPSGVPPLPMLLAVVGGTGVER